MCDTCEALRAVMAYALDHDQDNFETAQAAFVYHVQECTECQHPATKTPAELQIGRASVDSLEEVRA